MWPTAEESNPGSALSWTVALYPADIAFNRLGATNLVAEARRSYP